MPQVHLEAPWPATITAASWSPLMSSHFLCPSPITGPSNITAVTNPKLTKWEAPNATGNRQLATGELQLNIATCHGRQQQQRHSRHIYHIVCRRQRHTPPQSKLWTSWPRQRQGLGTVWKRGRRQRGHSGRRWGQRGDHFTVCVCATAQIASARHLYTCHAARYPSSLPCRTPLAAVAATAGALHSQPHRRQSILL